MRANEQSDRSDQSSEIDKYKTTLNFDELSQNSSLGILSSQEQSSKLDDRRNTGQNLVLKNLMESLLTPSKLRSKNLKLEELAASKQTRESRW
jgi:hypothetical protein